MERDEQLVAMRPALPSARVTTNMSEEELFQNITLRPIVKLQNDLLVAAFKNYIVQRKNVFHNLKADQRSKYIEHSVNRDQRFKNLLKGMIVGCFTQDEYATYMENSTALNKRIMNLIRERLMSNILLFAE
ncbi:MAG: glyoxalase [Nonlabens sp.]